MRMPKTILVLSDATGETAERVVRAGLQQFSDHVVHVRVQSHITRPEQLGTWFRAAATQEAFVVTTLVEPEMRDVARTLATDHGVAHVELLGSLLGELESFLQQAPVNVPGLMYQADDAYFRRIEAVEFTVKADDGKEPRMLREADIILVGVSRTSKTPLSVYLAHKGFTVANVPVVLDRPLPEDRARDRVRAPPQLEEVQEDQRREDGRAEEQAGEGREPRHLSSPRFRR